MNWLDRGGNPEKVILAFLAMFLGMVLVVLLGECTADALDSLYPREVDQ